MQHFMIKYHESSQGQVKEFNREQPDKLAQLSRACLFAWEINT